MEPFSKWYIRIQFTSALIAITLQSIIIKNIIPSNNLPSFIYIVLAASSTYYLLYRSFVFIYEKWAWKWLLKDYNISGTWYHEFRCASEPNYCRRGLTIIRQKAIGIRVNAVNYNQDFDIVFRTLWNDTSVTINETGRLVISYVAHVYTYHIPPSDKKPPEKTGVIYLTIIHDKNNKPIRLDGIFHDSSPPFRRGTVTWWKNVEWKDRVEQIESTIGCTSCESES